MLKTISRSSNRKLGGCAATYRSGSQNVYGTCPNTCNLKPAGQSGSDQVDAEYLQAVIDAVPRGGLGWTYSHFGPDVIPAHVEGKTVVNLSADSMSEAVEYFRQHKPTTVAVPKDQDSKVEVVDGVRFVRCPAEYNDKVTCDNCGGGVPLCARADRNYVIKFTAHGVSAKLVGKDCEGGCYGSSGPVAIHWHKTRSQEQSLSDAETLRQWVRKLPYGTKVRHHVVGDVGIEQEGAPSAITAR